MPMNFAAAVKEGDNLPPAQQPHPDTGLLVHADHNDDTAFDAEKDKVNIVDEQTAEQLRQAIERDEPSEADHFAKVKREAELRRVHAQAANAAALANKIKTDHAKADTKAAAKEEVAHTKELGKEVAAEAAKEAKHFTADAKAHGAEIYAEGKDLAGKAEKKGEQLAGEAKAKGQELAGEAKSKGKELAGEAKAKASEYEKKGEKALSAAEKKAAELEKRAEAEARELKRKADKAARAAARELRAHPFATSGVVGVLNFALVAGTGYLAYTNWNRPHWDRKVVGAVAATWAALVGAQVAGYEEVFAQ